VIKSFSRPSTFMFRLSSLRTSRLLALAVLLAATVVARPVRSLPTGLGAFAPEIETLYNAGSYSSAAEALQAAIAQNPKDASLYYWLGRCYFEIRDFNRSISNWERCRSGFKPIRVPRLARPVVSRRRASVMLYER
jgi:tetratricopeptide (TPR) repeat protein